MRLAESQESVEPSEPSEEDSGSIRRRKNKQCPKLLIGQVRVFPPLTWKTDVALSTGCQHGGVVERGQVDAELSIASSEDKHLPPSVPVSQEAEK